MTKKNNRISVLRKKAGLTQSDLAAELGLTGSMVSRIERGIAELSSRHIEKLASIFGVSQAAILDDVVDLDAVAKEMLVKFDQLTDTNKRRIVDLVEAMKLQQDQQISPDETGQ